MKSLDSDAELQILLEDYAIENLDWPDTDDELDRFLTTPLRDDTYSDEEIEARVNRVLNPNATDDGASIHVCEHKIDRQGLLFDIDLSTEDRKQFYKEDPKQSKLGLSEIVKQAFIEVHGDYSIDKLIADPNRNAAFIQACWRLGAQASQYELAHILLNARKNKLMGKIDGVSRYCVPREEMDHYLFASEFALRMLQDQEYFANQRDVSLDRILCEPELAKRFEELARSIVPGYSSLDYRWAALTIRKCQNCHVSGDLPTPVFERLGSRDNLRPSRIEKRPGFFWLLVDSIDVYIGHAQNLRQQLESLADARLHWMLPDGGLLAAMEPAKIEYAIASYPIASATKREPVKTQLVRHNEPKLNVLDKGRRVA